MTPGRPDGPAFPGRTGSLFVIAGLLLAGVAAPVGVTLAAADAPEFDPTIVSARQGETASVGISVPEGANASYGLAIGSRDEGFLVRATVRDADGDGSITVAVDTGTAGDGDPGAYLAVSEGDALRNATQVTPADDPDRPLPAGMYDLDLAADDELVAVGTLTVSGPYGGEPGTTAGSDAHAGETTTLGDTGTNFVYEGDAITLENASGQVVRGETTLDPGTEVVVRLRSMRHNFLMSYEVTVSESGTFDATVDLYDVAAGATFEAQAFHNGTTVARADGEVVECSADCAGPTTTDATGNAATTLPADEIGVQSVVEVTRTETASIPVTFGDADALAVVVGGDSVNYEVVGTVRDADGDDRAIVRFYTENAGFEAPTLGSDDELTLGNESSLPSVLDAGTYPVRVYRGANASGAPATMGRIVVYEAGASDPGGTTDESSHTTTTTEPSVPGNDERTPPTAGDGGTRLLGGVGMIAAGGVLAVAGIAVVLGLFRN